MLSTLPGLLERKFRHSTLHITCSTSATVFAELPSRGWAPPRLTIFTATAWVTHQSLSLSAHPAHPKERGAEYRHHCLVVTLELLYVKWLRQS
jgi:hypothetical protein